MTYELHHHLLIEEMVFQMAVPVQFHFRTEDDFLNVKPAQKTMRRSTPPGLEFLLTASDLGFEVDHESVEADNDKSTVIGHPEIATVARHVRHEAFDGAITNPHAEVVGVAKDTTHQEERRSLCVLVLHEERF
jgi:hypothetical protein